MGHKVKQSLVKSRIDFFYYAFRNILLVSVPVLIVSGVVLFNLYIHSSATIPDSSSDSLSISISSACTISNSTSSAHTVSVNAGSYTANIGNTRVNAYCNDNNGYSIYAIGTSGDVDGNTKLISNINDGYNISTGIYDSSTLSSATPSSWSMKLTAGSGTGAGGEAVTPPTIVNNYSTYNVVPSTYTLVASRGSGTNMTTNTDITGSYFTTTYDVYASSVQPAGTYTGKVKYAMIHPYSSSSVVTFEDAFARAGKEQVTVPGSGIYYKMQDMNPAICNSVNVYNETSSTQLIDIRDNNIYWVNKLDDGHCWMTQNLDLSIGGAGVTVLNSNNTDISTDPSVYTSSDIYSNGYTEDNGVWTWSPASTATTTNYNITYPNNTNNPTVSPTWPIDNTGHTTPYSAEGGDAYYYTSNNGSNDTRYTSLASCATSGRTEAECKRYATGNYYNWTAAIASNNSTNLGSDPEVIATNSICPKGWRLPNASQTDNVNNEFGRMLYKAGITSNLSAGNESVGYATGGFNKLRSNPYYFVRSGGISGGTLNNSGARGYYWSSTVSSSTDAYFLYFNGTDIYPAINGLRDRGRSVRCVAC